MQCLLLLFVVASGLWYAKPHNIRFALSSCNAVEEMCMVAALLRLARDRGASLKLALIGSVK
jgi:hypothetical protein